MPVIQPRPQVGLAMHSSSSILRNWGAQEGADIQVCMPLVDEDLSDHLLASLRGSISWALPVGMEKKSW